MWTLQLFCPWLLRDFGATDLSRDEINNENMLRGWFVFTLLLSVNRKSTFWKQSIYIALTVLFGWRTNMISGNLEHSFKLFNQFLARESPWPLYLFGVSCLCKWRKMFTSSYQCGDFYYTFVMQEQLWWKKELAGKQSIMFVTLGGAFFFVVVSKSLIKMAWTSNFK